MKGSASEKEPIRTMKASLRRCGAGVLGGLALAASPVPNVVAADLYLGNIPQSNILFLIDDALNLDYEKLIAGEDNQSRYYLKYENLNNAIYTLPHCAGYNKLAYDPSKTYEPWWGEDSEGNTFDDQKDITSVPLDPYLPKDQLIDDLDQLDLTNDIDLSEHFYLVWNDADNDGEYDSGECPNINYLHKGCYDRSGSSGVKYDSDTCVSVADMAEADQVNFANWYAYHRKREYILKYALAEVIQESEARIGVGFTTVPNGNDAVTRGMEIKDVDDQTTPVDPDAQDNKKELMRAIFSLDAKAPDADKAHVRRMLEAAGNYFEREEVYGSGEVSGVNQLFGYGDDEEEPESPIIISDARGTCQKNATIVISSRYENSSDGSNYSERIYHQNIDGDNSSDYDGNWVDSTSPQDSYADDRIDTLADVAMFFYERDLYPDVDNPNVVQRMSSYMVALGVKGTLDAGPSNTTDPFAWPDRVNNNPETIDDMRHAAWNSRGSFHDPDDGEELVAELRAILQNVDETAEDAASVSGSNMLAVSSVRASSESHLYVTRFTSGNWEGRLLAYPVDATTLETGSAEWDAADMIPAHASRNILSHNGASGFTFNTDAWNAASGGFSDAQKTALNTLDGSVDTSGANRVAYLRGDQSLEGNPFRSRDTLLGDIVNSDAFYTHDENHQYYNLEPAESDGTDSYYYYLANEKIGRQAMVYVGANDGMLHGFQATGALETDLGECSPNSESCAGEELFAYVPKAVYSKLSELTDPDYSHNYYVDGPAYVSDAYFDYKDTGSTGSSRWGSVLVGSLGAGGAGVFALDISKPDSFSTHDVLWDLDATDLPHLGESNGRVYIVKLPTGDWAAVFGNGYNSASYKAGLYIVPLDDPDSALFIDTEFDGTADAPNGLSTAFPADTDGDLIADRVYAGDLLGNMWAFDLSADNSNGWKVAYKAGSTPKPLFRACTDGDCTNPQPITSAPEVIRYTDGQQIVLFGTGSYLDADDVTSTQEQTFYGIFDDGSNTVDEDRSELQQQSIELEFYTEGLDYRIFSQNSVDYSTHSGWYIDFNSSNYEGERIISDPFVRNGLVGFTTFTPDNNVCSRDGGDSWFLYLNVLSGAREDYSPYDVNNDGSVDDDDLQQVVVEDGKITGLADEDSTSSQVVAASGRKLRTGLAKTPAIFDNGDKESLKFDTSSGSVDEVEPPTSQHLGRQSWLQVR